jgi:hypothetical protein
MIDECKIRTALIELRYVRVEAESDNSGVLMAENIFKHFVKFVTTLEFDQVNYESLSFTR